MPSAAQPPPTEKFSPLQCLDLRYRSPLPPGKTLYIQSGDPGDFDGYLIGVAGHQLEQCTKNMEYALVMPERRACGDRDEPDVNKHDDIYSDKVMQVAGSLVRLLCPKARIVRGPVNKRNIIPLKFIFSEPDKYGPLLEKRATASISWRAVVDLAELVERPEITAVMIDMYGSLGYLELLKVKAPSLGAKMKASGMPVCIMAGVLAELEAATLRVPGRDPRATMNAIYHADAVQSLLDMAHRSSIPLLFVTNNTCNNMLKFENADETIRELSLKGLLKDLAEKWYGPHLKGKCVPFDWVSFTAMLLHNRFPALLKTERRELWVGKEDASILVLHDPALGVGGAGSASQSKVVQENLEGTQLWGMVESVVEVDRAAMLSLCQMVAAGVPS